ncbi:hypothetical protein WP1_159 [Pseudomonas phage WP1]
MRFFGSAPPALASVKLYFDGKCTICNGSGQVWISDEPQRHLEDCPQCAPKFEKTDVNRLAEVTETSIRLEKELEESEKRWSEPEASQAENAEKKRLSEAYEWGHEDGQNNPPGCSSKEERDACVNELLKRPDLAKADCEEAGSGWVSQRGSREWSMSRTMD